MKLVENAPSGIWAKSHYLNRMTLRELVAAYFQHYTIQTYLGLAAVAVVVAILFPTTLLRGAGAAVSAALIYPLVWYALHRFVLRALRR